MKLDFSSNPPSIHWDELQLEMVYKIESHENVIRNKLRATVNACDHLSARRKHLLFSCLQTHNPIFDGTLGLARGVSPVTLDLKEGTKPIQSRAIPIPQSKVQNVMKDIDELVQLGVIERTKPTEWSFPSFVVPKKDGTDRIVTDFRKLNEKLNRKPFPIPTLNELIHSLHDFTYVTLLDLRKGYYHFALSEAASRLCTTILPWGYYRYLRLPMGISPAADIFQYEISNIFIDLPFVKVYFDDLLIYSKGTFEEHLQQVETVLQRLHDANLQVHLDKSRFAVKEVEYLGYLISTAGYKPQIDKVQAILRLQPPTNVKQTRKFLGFVNFYKDFIAHRSHLLQPIIHLTKKHVPFQWGSAQTQAFIAIKEALAKQILLKYPDPNNRFDIFTDASDYAIAMTIEQEGAPVAFYSQTLTSSQRNYTTTQKETLAIVKGLEAYRNILLGRDVHIHNDHKNITFLSTTNPQTLRWLIAIAEYTPQLDWIDGHTNVTADFLSRYPISQELSTYTLDNPYELFAVENTDICEQCPVDYSMIRMHQINDQQLQNCRNTPGYSYRIFHKSKLLIKRTLEGDRIVVPTTLQTALVKWYHTFLIHQEMNRLESTIRAQFYFKGLRTLVATEVKTCPQSQASLRTPTTSQRHL